jgi:alpha-L-rhamnosidase
MRTKTAVLHAWGLLGLWCAAVLAASAVQAAPTTVAPVPTALQVEYKSNPLGLDVRQPRLGWRMESTTRGTVQTSYRVQVATSRAALTTGRGLLWDTGQVRSDQSAHVVYEGPTLASRQRYFWRVQVWDGAGQQSPWSEVAFWEMSLLTPSDWQAAWITPDWDEDTTRPQPAPLLRKAFRLRGTVRQARAYVTSLGLYELELNGQRVGDEVLTPGWTSYDTRLQYQTYDVTAHLRTGENAIGVALGDGWYRGYIGFSGQRNAYGDRLAALVQLHITYADGRTEVVGSDATWKATTGPIRMADIYNGEHYDARLEPEGWSQPGFDDRAWAGTRTLDHPKTILVAPAGPPVRKIQEIKPVAIWQTPAGETVFDFGQNMVGWVRLKVAGPPGTTVTLRHAEVLDKHGNFYTDNLRAAAQRVQYTLRGGSPEVYEPRFTFQGFRYVAVEGYPGTPTAESLTGIVVHSDMPPTGHWESSNPLLNQLQHNIVWGQKGNFVDVPTDCPQRDERLGWTGDAQVFARTATFNMDVAGFYTKWLRDVAADQKPDGSVPFVIPDVLTRKTPAGVGSAAWADVAVILPWTVYLAYGDRRVLETQYPSMKAWVDYIRTRASGHLWNTGFHFGDWLAYATTNPDYPGATTSKDLIATAFFAYSTHLVAETAGVLGKEDDARAYRELFAHIRDAFNREYVSETGRVGENTQTAYALALQFGLLPDDKRPMAVQRLVQNIRQHGNHLTTGFVGTPYLCHVLSEHGQLDVAYTLLNQETYPSWLYPVKRGATTIWERWDGIRPDSTFQDAGMNSFNHYAYGAIGDWMYRVVAGLEIDPARPGYKHVLVQPQPGGGLTSVQARLNTLYGTVGSAWALVGEAFEVTVQVPPNTTATIRLPAARLEQVQEGRQAVATAPGVQRAWQEDEAVVVETGSGEYRFSYPAGTLGEKLRPR